MGQRGRAGRVHAHDKQRDEDHPQAGEEEQAAPGPVVRERCQDLRREPGNVATVGGGILLFVERRIRMEIEIKSDM